MVKPQLPRDTQLEREGLLGIPIQMRVNESVVAGSALLSINNATPYNAMYGRVPNLLPDINYVSADPEDSLLPGSI